MKTLLITGATSGIGFAAAQHFVKTGYRVLITGRDQARLAAATAATGCQGFICDSAQLDDIHALAEQLKAKDIQLDALVLNAGIFYPRPFEATDADNLAITMTTNFTGPFFTLQALLPCLKNPASVVFVSSVAVAKAHPMCAVYAASKAAFEAAAQVMNVELASRGIRVNSLRPGVTETEIQAKAGVTPEQMQGLKDSLAALPIGRILTPEDLVPALDYLVGEGSSAMRAGVLTVDGGFAL